MDIKTATDTIAKHVRETRKPLAKAVRDVWPSLGKLSENDTMTLVQEALAARVNPLLNRPYIPVNRDGEISVSVTRYNDQVPTKINVSVEILEDTVYHVGGEAKKLSLFTIDDVDVKLASVRAVEEGVVRHRKMWEGIKDVMLADGINTIGDLDSKRKEHIANLVISVRQSKDVIALD